MPKVTFTQEDVLQKTKLDAGWYPMKAVEIVEAVAKDKVSTNWVTKFVISEGPMAGVPIRHWFNEKAMGRVMDFLACFTGGKIDTGKEYELDQSLNRPILGFASFNSEMGFNTIQDFKPAPAATQTAA